MATTDGPRPQRSFRGFDLSMPDDGVERCCDSESILTILGIRFQILTLTPVTGSENFE